MSGHPRQDGPIRRRRIRLGIARAIAGAAMAAVPVAAMAAVPVAAMAGIAPARAACTLGIVASLPVSMDDMVASVPVTINGRQTRLGLDTGAFFNFMSAAKAAELGLTTRPMQRQFEGDRLEGDFQISGIGGSFTPRLATIKSFGLAGHTIRDVDFFVGGSDTGAPYLGANTLAAFDSEFDLAHGNLSLFVPTGCTNTKLGYWAGNRFLAIADLEPFDPHDAHIIGKVTVNGKVMRAMFDTGATSMLTRAAALRAGIDLNGPGVTAADAVAGLGTRSRRSWIVRVDRFEIGGETIQHSPMQVVDDDIDDDGPVDMLLGADFFLAHHILFSFTQHLVYLTYNGGPIFSIVAGDAASTMKTIEQNMGTTAAAADPADADGYARRGTARAARRDYPGAIADLTAAIARAPTNGTYLDTRADIYHAAGQDDLARADRTAALRLLPHDGGLLVRQGFDLADHDNAAALADAEAAARLIPPGALDNQRLVDLFERLHRPDRALALLAPMLALHTDDHARGWLLKERCYARGLANVEPDKAMADCATAIHRDGPDPDYLFARGLIHLRQKDWPAAIADFDVVTKANAAVTAAQWLRGVAEQAAGQTDAGAADLAAARRAHPDMAAYWGGYGLGGG